MRVQSVALEHHGDVALARGHSCDVSVADHDPTRSRGNQPGDDAQQRRLAAAARSEEHQELAVLDFEAQALQRRSSSELLTERT